MTRITKRKTERELAHHGITVDKSVKALDDLFAIEWIDERGAYREERTICSDVEGVILHETYTERGVRIRIISARRAEPHEQDDYYRQDAP